MARFALATLMFYTVIVVLPSECLSQSYLGKTFYLATMSAYVGRPDLYKPVLLKIVSNEAGTVKIVMPTLKINTTYLLTPKVTDIFINGSGMRADVIGIANKGIQIISTVEVAIYAIEGATLVNYGDVIPVIPVINSAKEFVVQSYETKSKVLKSRFIIVGTEDLTDVNITLKIASPGNVTYNNIAFKNGDTIYITLNELQTFYAYVYANDLSGSLIESNKPIAVFSGSDCVHIPTHLRPPCDLIQSQMIPVNLWGYEYIVPPIYPSQCHVRTFAFYNDTRIFVKWNFALSSNITLNQGEFWETTLYGSQAQPLVISSNTVINVVLYGAHRPQGLASEYHPFMLAVPDIRQYSTFPATFPTLLYGDSIANTRPFENYAAIVVLRTSFNQLQYNGNVLEVLQNYSILNEYTVVIIQLNNVATHTISTVNMSTPIRMAVFVYGLAYSESYGFVAAYIYADCNGLEPPLNGSLSSINLSHGNHLTISCNHGFTLSGERVLVCLSGSLSANIGTCEPDCSGLMAPVHGSLSSKFASHDHHVTVSCDPGYKLSGDNILVCSSGSWSGNVGACVEDKGPTIECTSPATSIIVGAVLGFTIIVLGITILVMCIQKKSSQ